MRKYVKMLIRQKSFGFNECLKCEYFCFLESDPRVPSSLDKIFTEMNKQFLLLFWCVLIWAQPYEPPIRDPTPNLLIIRTNTQLQPTIVTSLNVRFWTSEKPTFLKTIFVSNHSYGDLNKHIFGQTLEEL